MRLRTKLRSVKALADWRPSRLQPLQWTASHTHPFELTLRRTLWPPFYATAAFLPKLKLSITNKGERLAHGASVQVDVCEFDGPIGEAPSHEKGWTDAQHIDWGAMKPWPSGETRTATARIPSRSLPRTGTYIVRFQVTGFRPQKAPREELEKSMEEWDMSPEARERAIATWEGFLTESGIDPDTAKPHAFVGERLYRAGIVDYFRIEALTAVLSFWLVFATFFLALATLLLAIAGL